MNPPVCYFDLETTSPDPSEAKIVEFCLNFWAEGSTGRWPDETVYGIVDPGVPIPEEAAKIHGFSTEDVEGKPGFSTYAAEVQEVVRESVLVGYNSRSFDTPILHRELREAGHAGLETDENGRITHREVDLYRMWCELEPRTLEGAVARFDGREHEGAHGAMQDTDVLPHVLYGMLEDFDLWEFRQREDSPAYERDREATIAKAMEITAPERAVDRYGKLKLDDEGRVCFAFGKKHKGEPVADHPDYVRWMIEDAEDFPEEVLAIVAAEVGR